MPMSYLFSLKYELDKNQSDMLILSPKYTFPTTSSNILYIYSGLTKVSVYYLK